MTKLRIALTGATGLLGRNLLFEYIKQHRQNLTQLQIVILGRSVGSNTLTARFKSFEFRQDAISYLGIQVEQADEINDFFDRDIQYIHADLQVNNLAISSADLRILKASPIDIFFHIASATDFRDSIAVKNHLWESNVRGTERILELVRSLEVHEFCYVSSAYGCGNISGQVMPNYINLLQGFRNPYELSKIEAEIKTREFAKEQGIRYRCFRPSTICGRLIEQPLGSINKFDVFYAWAGFWLYMKLKTTNNIEGRYKDRLTINAKICYSMNSGLNIVPSDYAAKVMYQVCTQKDPGESYHLVNNAETPHSLYFSSILDLFKIQGIDVSETIPTSLNRIESLYFKTVGKIYTPYITSAPMIFDTQNLSTVLKNSNLECPPVDRQNFGVLLEFAKNQDFGLTMDKFMSKDA
ncbi:MAG: hypothetical protein RLZZ135_2123 [Cyanobacteriota bacterium]|jgi:nucleoside-diphosphate-sugar epimerase